MRAAVARMIGRTGKHVYACQAGAIGHQDQTASLWSKGDNHESRSDSGGRDLNLVGNSRASAGTGKRSRALRHQPISLLMTDSTAICLADRTANGAWAAMKVM